MIDHHSTYRRPFSYTPALTCITILPIHIPHTPYNYNRMLNCHTDSITDEDFDQALHYKARMGSNSGYLDEEYETTKEFPTLPDYHFRIEDDAEILTLEKLKRESEPICMQATFNNSSLEFKSRLNLLLDCLDSRRVSLPNHMEEERHGFYTLADHYDDEGVIGTMLEKMKVEELRTKMEEISLKDIKPVFVKKPKKDKPIPQ